jgi:four helix bundle protein
MNDEKKNLILEQTFDFALRIVEYCELLEENKRYIIAKQLLRAATSIGANVREAQFAESKSDFVHKMKIAEKEANETEYWLMLCKHANKYPFNEELLNQLSSILKILSKIITTSKSNI